MESVLCNSSNQDLFLQTLYLHEKICEKAFIETLPCWCQLTRKYPQRIKPFIFLKWVLLWLSYITRVEPSIFGCKNQCFSTVISYTVDRAACIDLILYTSNNNVLFSSDIFSYERSWQYLWYARNMRANCMKLVIMRGANWWLVTTFRWAISTCNYFVMKPWYYIFYIYLIRCFSISKT